MKKFVLSALIIISITASVFSQNYQCIKTDAISHFVGTNNYIASIRIDSVNQYNGISDYFSYPMIRELENTYNEFTIKGASWIGEKFRVDTNGNNIFYNALHESITISKNVELNNSWVMYQSVSNNIIITARVTNIDTMSFIGLFDTVAVISMTATNIYNQIIQNPVNNYKLRLSKNYGLVSIMNFYRFPFINQTGTENLYLISDTLSLIGISNPIAGWQNITSYDVYNWLPEWEFHNSVSYSSGPGPGCCYGSGSQTIRKILDKTLTADSVIYSVDKCYYHSTYDNNGITNEYRGRDTIIETYKFSTSLDKLPLEPYIDGDISFYNKTIHTIEQTGIIFTGLHNDTCGYLIYDGYTFYTWTVGMGSTYHGEGFTGDQSNFNFVYYKKDTIEWGTPYTCSTLLESKINNLEKQVNIFPNPNNGLFTLEMIQPNSRSFTISIFDILGEKVFEINNINEGQNINIQELINGVYTIKIKTENEITLKKIIKQ